MATKGREKYNKLNRRRDTIISALADQKCAPGLAEKLRRDGLITNHVYKLVDVHAAGVTDDDRIRTLLNAVLGKVQVNPQIYDKFISILGEIQGLADIVSFIDGPLSEEEMLPAQPSQSIDQPDMSTTSVRHQQNGKCRWCLVVGIALPLCVIVAAVGVQYWNVSKDVSTPQVQPSTSSDRDTQRTQSAPPADSRPPIPPGPGTQDPPASGGFLSKRPTMTQLQLIKWPSGDKIVLIETTAVHWRRLGTTLGIPEQVLKGFATTHTREQEECLREVLQRWLDRGSVPKESYTVNWEGLINALEDTGLDVVADDMRQMISKNEGGESPTKLPVPTTPTKTPEPSQDGRKLSAADFGGFPEPTLPQLNSLLSSEVAARWEEIGEVLQIKQGVLSSIRANNAGHQNQQERCLREVFKKWYNGMTAEFSWKKIVEILLSMDEARVVANLYKKLKEN